MNSILKAILLTAETVAVTSVPGAQAVDSGVRAIVSGNKEQGIVDSAEGALAVIGAFKEADIANPVLFKEGCEAAKLAFDKIRASLKTNNSSVAN